MTHHCETLKTVRFQSKMFVFEYNYFTLISLGYLDNKICGFAV